MVGIRRRSDEAVEEEGRSYIGGSQIAMNNPTLVNVAKGLDNLLENAQGLDFVDSLSVHEPVPEVAVGAELHLDVERGIVLPTTTNKQ